MIFFVLFTKCSKAVLPLLLVAALFWLGGRVNTNFFYSLPAMDSTDSPDPHPTPYPPSFRIRFDTNISRQRTGFNQNPLSSTLYYDWSIPAQRIDHAAGAYECVRFYNVTTHGCQLYFFKKGMYRVISPEGASSSPSPPKLKPCCLDIPGLGPPPPNWAQEANPTFGGLKRDAYSGYDAYEFVFDNPSIPEERRRSLQVFGTVLDKYYSADKTEDIYDEFHTTREVHDGNPLRNGIPLTFTFPSKAKGLQDFHFDPESLVVGYQDPGFFQLPDGCDDTACG